MGSFQKEKWVGGIEGRRIVSLERKKVKGGDGRCGYSRGVR
jgi:hypothetical protein